MKHPRCAITLNDEQKRFLQAIIDNENTTARTLMHARILLESDSSNSECLTKEQLAKKLKTTHTTVQFVRDRYHQSGLNAALYKNYCNGSTHWKLTPQITDEIIELAKSAPDGNNAQWSLRRLCEACVKRGIVKSISSVSMMKLLKEHNIKLK